MKHKLSPQFEHNSDDRTNSMATKEDDIEKGGDSRTHQALAVCAGALTAALEHAGGSHESS